MSEINRARKFEAKCNRYVEDFKAKLEKAIINEEAASEKLNFVTTTNEIRKAKKSLVAKEKRVEVLRKAYNEAKAAYEEASNTVSELEEVDTDYGSDCDI